ncbi:MAG: dienelactone hydrolase family protein [Synechococcaceae cyanobacterium SM2_3_60]|nr:dienelactone hydrolase family protein [Synechococcaceae cyanobacterium SM2_3_60]
MLSRRQFVTASLAAGFALAVRPAIGQSIISTPADGLDAGFVNLDAGDGLRPAIGHREIPAYRAQPAGATNLPVILVVQEIFGIHEYIQDVCRRLAQLGYLAIAPDLYVRQGDVTQLSDVPTIFAEVVSKVPDAQVMADLDATATWAAANNGDPSRLGITGFCWGGRIVWLYAAHNPNLTAGVAWYGRFTGDRNDLQPTYPLDVAADINMPVLGLYGELDDGIPLDTVEAMQTALSGSDSEIIVYPDAPHGFHADYRPSYRPEAAEAAWEAMQAWFSTHGVV